jgi:hypothetical protein
MAVGERQENHSSAEYRQRLDPVLEVVRRRGCSLHNFLVERKEKHFPVSCSPQKEHLLCSLNI